MSIKKLKIHLGHRFRAYRFGLFNAKRIYRFMKTTENQIETEIASTQNVPTITVFKAQEMLEGGNFLIQDVRSTGD